MGAGRRVWKELLLELLIYAAGMASVFLFFRNNIVTTVLVIATGLVALKFWHKKHDLYFYVAGAVVGSVGEIIYISFGVWQYANPTFLGIPMWLPFGWGSAVMIIKRIAETFVKIEMK